jgi:hypothetical protein
MPEIAACFSTRAATVWGSLIVYVLLLSWLI